MQPSTVPRDARFLAPVSVVVQNSASATLTSATFAVTLSVGPNPPAPVTLSGTTTVSAVNGVATFPDVTLSGATGVGFTLRATASGSTAGVSVPFTIGEIPPGDGLGHLDAAVMNFQRFGVFDGPYPTTFSGPQGVAVDPAGHRLFVADAGCDRVLVFQLSAADDFGGVDRAADHVLGQADFRTPVLGTGTTNPGPARLWQPSAVAYDAVDQRLFVADTRDHRVLVFDAAALQDGMAATRVLGQVDFDETDPGSGPAQLDTPRSLAYDAATGRLFVADAGNDRVLVFDAGVLSLQDGMAASFELAAPGAAGVALDPPATRLFVSSPPDHVLAFDLATLVSGMSPSVTLGTGAGTTDADSLVDPAGLWHDAADRLFVADAGNCRVVVFDTATLTDLEPAVNVLGQASFGAPATPVVSASGTAYPTGCAGAGDALFVVDEGASRVLRFDVASLSDGQAAVDGLGHLDSGAMEFTRRLPHDGAYPDSFAFPACALVDPAGHRLFVSDWGCNRVLVFELSPSNDFAGVDRVADVVLGQADFREIAAGDLDQPGGLALIGDQLFVADTNHSRVVVYDLSALASGMSPSRVLGQPDLGTLGGPGSARDRMWFPYGLAADAAGDRLFVADITNDRVLVFEGASSIGDGAPATHVLGRPFATTAASGMLRPFGVAFDGVGDRLFVADQGDSRVLVFDASALADGADAFAVLGQPDFTTVTPTFPPTPDRMSLPIGVAFDEARGRLFVVDRIRCLVFDATTIDDGEPAVSVLGAGSLSSYTGTLLSPQLPSVDPTTGRLYVPDESYARVLVFELP